MAQNPNFQPILNQTSFEANAGAMVNRLKGASSNLSALGELGKIAVTGVGQLSEYQKAQELANVKEQVGAALDPLIQETLMGSPSTVEETRKEKGDWELFQSRLPYNEAPEDPEVLNQTISAVQNEIDKRFTFLEKAKNQGRIGTREFEQRLKDITRKFISDNPALRDEILKTAKNTLEDQGIIDLVVSDEKAAEKQAALQAEEFKFYRQYLKDEGLSPIDYEVNGVLNIDAAKQAISKVVKAKAIHKAFLDDSTAYKQATENELRDLENSDTIPNIMQGQLLIDRAAIANIFTELGATKPELAIFQAKDYLNQSFMKLRNNPNYRKFSSSQVVKDNLAAYEKIATAMVDNMASFTKQEDRVAISNNALKLLENKQNLEYINAFPDSKFLELGIKIGQIPGVFGAEGGTAFLEKLVAKGNAIFNNGALADKSLFETKSNAPTSVMSALTTQSLELKDPNLINKTINAYVDGINNTKIHPTQLDQFRQADKFIKDLSDSTKMESFIDLDPNVMTKTLNLLRDYNEQIDIDLQRYFTQNPDKSVKLEINPTTGFVYSTGDATSDFNNRYTIRINDALKAYANIRTQTPKEVWKDFYQEYYPSISQGKTLTSEAKAINNPLNIRTASGKPINFGSLEDSVKNFEDYIINGLGSTKTNKIAAQEFEKNKRLFEQKKISKEEYNNRASSLNNALKASIQEESTKPKTIKTIVNQFYEDNKLNASQESREQSYAYLADLLTKSPNTPLDLSNKETIAKLYTGLAYLETGTDNLDWLRVSSLLKRKYKTTKEKNEEEFRKSPMKKAEEEFNNFQDQMETNFPNRSK